MQAYELYVFFLDHKKQMIFKKMNYIACITFIMCETLVMSYEHQIVRALLRVGFKNAL